MQERMDAYAEAFDIVILHDGDMSPVLDILNAIMIQ
jgi:hypothetical protein